MAKLKWRNHYNSYWKTSPPGYLIFSPSPDRKNYRLTTPTPIERIMSGQITKHDLDKHSYHPTLAAAKASAQRHHDHKDDPPKPKRAKTKPMPDTRQYLEALDEVTRS